MPWHGSPGPPAPGVIPTPSWRIRTSQARQNRLLQGCRDDAAAQRRYLVFPSLSYCEMNAQRSLTSFSFLMPANAILVPGIFAFGSLMYSLNWASFQVMPEFLLPSE